MILTELDIRQFGGITGSCVSFTPGLNICLGPNEAGKSTHINAIYMLLFMQSNVRKNSSDFKNYVEPYFPFTAEGHSDFIEAALNFTETGEDLYRLTKRWGENRTTNMVLPNGQEITGEKNVSWKLQEFLPYSRATYESVVFAKQAEIMETVERLRENSEATADISHNIRSMMWESDGVSKEKLQAELDEEINTLLKYWDYERGRPKNNRGIDNPYANPGKLLSEYYQMERLRRRIREVEELEENLSQVNAQLTDKQEEYRRLQDSITELERLEQDIRKRASLKPEYRDVQKNLEEVKIALAEFPKIEEKIRHLEQEKVRISEQIEKLEKQRQQTKQYNELIKKKKVYQEVSQLYSEKQKLVNQLKQYEQVNEESLTRLRELENYLNQITAKIEAVNLRGVVISKYKQNIVVETGTEASRSLQVEEQVEISGKGRIKISTEEWSVEVKSGDEDIDSLLNQSEDLKKEHEELLKSCAASDMSEVEKAVAEKKEFNNNIAVLEDKISRALENVNYSDLERELTVTENQRILESGVPEKTVEDISGEIQELQIQREKMTYEIDNLSNQLSAWQQNYGDQHQIIEAYGKIYTEHQRLEEQLEELASLPKNYSSEDEFLAELKTSRDQLKNIQAQLSELKEHKHQLERELPEMSVEELTEQFHQAQKEFKKLQSRADSLMVIQEELNKVAEQESMDNFQGLEETFFNYLPMVTEHNYVSADMQGVVPNKIKTPRGRKLPVELLSAGTKSGVALALRLATASFLLNDMQGFIVLDDPMVDLDPDRRRGAAQMISEFAREKQVIISTCNPQTAELLGGNIIEF